MGSRRGDFGDRQPTLATQGEKAKMGKSQSEGGASTYIYGLIFVLYAGIAVVLFIYMMNKRSKQQKGSETENVESEEAKEGVANATSPSKATPQPTQETIQVSAGEKSGTVEEKAKKKKGQVDEVESEAKETTFVSPTEEEIKQLCETPKAAEAKKKE